MLGRPVVTDVPVAQKAARLPPVWGFRYNGDRIDGAMAKNRHLIGLKISWLGLIVKKKALVSRAP